MNYKENQAHYYEFILDDSLFNKKKVDSGPKSNSHNDIQDYLNTIYQLKNEEEKSNSFYTYLHSFINEKFNRGGIRLPASNNRAFIISRTEKNIEDCKEFCKYLADNVPVLTLLIKHRDDKYAFNAGLETVYNTLQLEKELNFNNGSVTKKT
jgi:hypothetical protein